MEIVETIQDMGQGIEKNFGKTGLMLAVGGLVAFGVYSYHNSSNDSIGDTATANLSVSGYPTVDTNADVVISTLQDNIEGAKNEILESNKGISASLDSNFEATNNYIQDGLNNQIAMNDKLNTLGSVSAMTYSELMLLQEREGHLANTIPTTNYTLNEMGIDITKYAPNGETLAGWGEYRQDSKLPSQLKAEESEG